MTGVITFCKLNLLKIRVSENVSVALWYSALLGWIAAAIKMKVPPHHVFLNTGKREMREFPRNAQRSNHSPATCIGAHSCENKRYADYKYIARAAKI